MLLSADSYARAASIVLNSVNGGTWRYGLEVGTDQINFFPGEGFTLTGVAGITSAQLNPFEAAFFNLSVSGTTVSVTEYLIGGVGLTGSFSNFFTITSNATAVGSLSYVVTGEPGSSGSVLGPVASTVTPEPSSLALLGTGILGVARVIHRRLLVR